MDCGSAILFYCVTVLLICCCPSVYGKDGCDFPTLTKNTVPYGERSKWYPEKSLFYYQCKPGYHFQGDQIKKHKIRCRHGEWLPSQLFICYDGCYNRCTPGNGECVKSIDNYSCFCKPNFAGQFCDQRVCESLPSIQHGKLEMVSGKKKDGKYSVGTRVILKCDDGYSHSMKESLLIICGTNGWSKLPVLLACQRRNCSTPPFINKAMKESRTYAVGESVIYSCYTGFIMVGNNKLICDDNLSWSGERPACYSAMEFKRYCLTQSKQMIWSGRHYVCENRRVQTTKAVMQVRQSSSTKPLVIVTATAGGLLLLLLLVISLVACQRRRIVRANLRHGGQRLNGNDERYSLVYYSNNLHVVLPSYDEAIQTHRQIQPPAYLNEDSVDINAQDVQNGSTVGSEYATIDDVIPELRTLSNPPSCNEPLYATIQRDITAVTTYTTDVEEDGRSISTVISQEGSPSSDDDNISSINIYNLDEGGGGGELLPPDNISLSSAEMCMEDDEPLIGPK